MKKSEELRRTTMAMGFVALSLSLLIAHSLFDIKAVARTTISRLPASLTRGVMAESAHKKSPSLTQLDIECENIKDDPVLQVNSRLLQFNFKNCDGGRPLELINLTNGFEATLFKDQNGAVSDLVSLKEGLNEIHVRLEKSPTPYSFKVKVSL